MRYTAPAPVAVAVVVGGLYALLRCPCACAGLFCARVSVKAVVRAVVIVSSAAGLAPVLVPVLTVVVEGAMLRRSSASSMRAKPSEVARVGRYLPARRACSWRAARKRRETVDWLTPIIRASCACEQPSARRRASSSAIAEIGCVTGGGPGGCEVRGEATACVVAVSLCPLCPLCCARSRSPERTPPDP